MAGANLQTDKTAERVKAQNRRWRVDPGVMADAMARMQG